LPSGHIEFPAVLQTVDEINRNTNLYPHDVLMDALHNERIEELVKRHCWFGEEAHPWDRSFTTFRNQQVVKVKFSPIEWYYIFSINSWGF